MSLLGALSGVKSKHKSLVSQRQTKTKQGQVCVPVYLKQVLQEWGVSPPGSPWQSCGGLEARGLHPGVGTSPESSLEPAARAAEL